MSSITGSKANKLLKEVDFTKISQPSTSSSSGHRSKRPKFPESSPTRSTARSKRQKTPDPNISINKKPRISASSSAAEAVVNKAGAKTYGVLKPIPKKGSYLNRIKN